MTILVGVRCRDGLVIGSDSAATFVDAAGTPTIFGTCNKLSILDERLILAHAGSVGLGQRFADVVDKNLRAGLLEGGNSVAVARTMCRSAMGDFQATGANPDDYSSLAGFMSSDGVCLCEFSGRYFQPELKTDVWYCSLGSGQSLVDPFLGLFRKTFWGEGPPSLIEGRFVVAWALELAVELSPGFVAGPIRIAVIDKAGRARLLNEMEIENHGQDVNHAVEHLGGFLETLKRTRPESAIPDS